MATPEQLAQVGIAADQADVLLEPRPVAVEPARASVSWRRARIGTDIAMLAAAFVVVSLGFPRARVDAMPSWWALIFALLVVGVSFFRGAYDWRVRVQPIDDCWSVVVTCALAAMS